jgi:flagellar protein FliO/FliZ
MKFIQYIFILTVLFLPAEVTASGGEFGNPTATVFKLIGALVLVLGIIFLLYALNRKGFNPFNTSKSGEIKVVEMRYLMPKKALCLINVRGEDILVGVGTDRIELIARLDNQQGVSFEDTLAAGIEANQ